METFEDVSPAEGGVLCLGVYPGDSMFLDTCYPDGKGALVVLSADEALRLANTIIGIVRGEGE